MAPRGNFLHLAMAALVGLANLGCGNTAPTKVPAVSVESPSVNLQAARRDAEQFCGNCHATPLPESFPQDRWPHEIDRGYEFYLLSGRTDLTLPRRTDLAAYYQQLAPERLEMPNAPLPQSKPRFAPLELTWPAKLHAPATVAHVWPQAKPADLTTDFAFCDMRSGTVAWITLAAGQIQVQHQIQLGHPDHLSATDLDGDHQLDYLVCDLGSFLPEDHDRGRLVWIRPGTAARGFEELVLLDKVGRVAAAQAADFDGDGDLDVIVAVFGWHTTGGLVLLRQTGREAGRPQFHRELLDERNGAIHVPIADLNSDGRPDFVALFSQEHEAVEAFLSQPDGQFDRQMLYRAPDPSYGSSGIELVDLDRDGDLDVLYTNGDTFDSYYVKPYHGIRWIENRGSAGWHDRLLANLPGVHRALAGDLDGDGDLDIAACCLISPTSIERQPEITRVSSLVWLEQGEPGNFAMHEIEADRAIHATLALADVNGDGVLDLVVGNFAQSPKDAPPPLTVWLNQGRP
jgi:hypothetical protein